MTSVILQWWEIIALGESAAGKEAEPLERPGSGGGGPHTVCEEVCLQWKIRSGRAQQEREEGGLILVP